MGQTDATGIQTDGRQPRWFDLPPTSLETVFA
jgi:hypothetical protein